MTWLFDNSFSKSRFRGSPHISKIRSHALKWKVLWENLMIMFCPKNPCVRFQQLPRWAEKLLLLSDIKYKLPSWKSLLSVHPKLFSFASGILKMNNFDMISTPWGKFKSFFEKSIIKTKTLFTRIFKKFGLIQGIMPNKNR